MTLEQIKNSGLLELYVLGDLDSHSRSEVEAAIATYPELKEEIADIEKALFFYAQAHKIEPPKHILDELLKTVEKDKSTLKVVKSTEASAPKRSINWLSGLLAAASLALFLISFYQYNTNQTQEAKYTALLEDCDKNQRGLNVKLAKYEQLNDKRNNVVSVTATEKYPETKIVLHTNDATKTNFLQLQNLPVLADNQSFQLWSLKGEDTPIPLDVFQSDADILLAVKHIDSTDAYAITIEPKGGQQSPTLANLIGLFKLKG